MSTTRSRRRMLMESTSRRKVSASATPSSPARAMNARMSLGRQPPPKPSPALRNLPPDARVVPMRVGQLGHVGAGRLAELGHRVDEGDLGGEEGVGRDLDQLGGGAVGDDHGRAGGERGGVDLAQHRRSASPSAPGSRRRAGRGQGVLDGVALAEELGVPAARVAPRPSTSRAARPPRCRPGRSTCRRRRRRGRGGAIRPSTAPLTIGEVGGVPVALCGVPTQMKWTSRLGVGDSGVNASRPVAAVGEQLRQSGLVERRPSPRKRVDLRLVDVDADDVVAHLGHAAAWTAPR